MGYSILYTAHIPTQSYTDMIWNHLLITNWDAPRHAAVHRDLQFMGDGNPCIAGSYISFYPIVSLLLLVKPRFIQMILS